jgi:hypothetical protein
MRTDALAKGDAKPLHTLTMGESVPEGFVFSPDGRYLYGSSFYTGVSNVYRYELATEKLEAMSNADIGFFRPLPLQVGELMVLRYSAKGFVPTIIDAKPTEDLSAVTFLGEQVASKYPEVQSWVATTPATIPYESQIVRQGPYRPARTSWPSIHSFRSSRATRTPKHSAPTPASAIRWDSPGSMWTAVTARRQPAVQATAARHGHGAHPRMDSRSRLEPRRLL